MRIRTSIHLTLGTVLVLHVFTAIMGHVGLERSQQNLAVYESVNSDTLRVLLIDEEITDLQRSVSDFMLTGHESSADRVRELIVILQTNIGAASEDTEQSVVRDQLNAMSARILSFSKDFEKVTVDRQLKSDLIDSRMVPIKQQILETLQTDHSVPTLVRYEIHEHIQYAESAALRYFNTPNRIRVDETVENLSAAQQKLAALDHTEDTHERVQELIQEYNQVFLEAVQATQGYMHLVNVVLAGDAAELHYQSSEIREESLAMRSEIGTAMRSGIQGFQAWSDFIAVLTVLAGVITAWLMTRTVLSPILGMTNTLQGLTTGQEDTEIPYLGRQDEIGLMANAAQVFRLKNDQTEHLLEESRSMQEDLEKRNNEMTEFVYTVSHDLKSPLVTIQGFTGVLEYAVESKNYDEIQGMVQRIQAASVRLSQTIDDLLELSRIGMMVNEFDEFRFEDCVSPVLADLTTQINDSQAEIIVQGGSQIIYADQPRIRQVIQNLVQNAIVYGHQPETAPKITIAATRTNGEMVISVSDDGPGIEKEYQDRVFGIFQRLSSSTNGTGVGLAIVRKVARAHGGRSWVESGDEGGCVFSISFPVTQAVAAAA